MSEPEEKDPKYDEGKKSIAEHLGDGDENDDERVDRDGISKKANGQYISEGSEKTETNAVHSTEVFSEKQKNLKPPSSDSQIVQGDENDFDDIGGPSKPSDDNDVEEDDKKNENAQDDRIIGRGTDRNEADEVDKADSDSIMNTKTGPGAVDTETKEDVGKQVHSGENNIGADQKAVDVGGQASSDRIVDKVDDAKTAGIAQGANSIMDQGGPADSDNRVGQSRVAAGAALPLSDQKRTTNTPNDSLDVEQRFDGPDSGDKFASEKPKVPTAVDDAVDFAEAGTTSGAPKLGGDPSSREGATDSADEDFGSGRPSKRLEVKSSTEGISFRVDCNFPC